MGFFSKILGIDKARNKANDALKAQAALTEQARQDAITQQENTLAEQKAHNDTLIAMQNNANALQDANNATANMTASTNVVAGGAADAITQLRKKRTAPSLSSSLGINA